MYFEKKVEKIMEGSYENNIPILSGLKGLSQDNYYALYGKDNTINYIAKVETNGKLSPAGGTDKLKNFNILSIDKLSPKQLANLINKIGK